MKRKFKNEYSIYMIGALIASVGLFLLIARSDAILKYRYFNDSAEHSVIQQDVDADQNLPVYLLLTGPDQPELQDSLKERLELMGKEVVAQSLSSVKSDTALAEYTGVVVATEQLDLVEETDVLLRFVKNGGSLFLAVHPSPGPALSKMDQALGIVETGLSTETSGVHLERTFFGEGGDTIFQSESIANSSLSVKLDDDVELLASSSSDIPLLWKTSYGEGAFIVFNGTMFNELDDQALFVTGIQNASEYVIMPVINAGVTELSGFPFFVSEERDLSSSYTNHDYYRTIVWPELQRIESKYDLNYTATYQAPDDDGLEDRKLSLSLEELKLYSRELLRMGGEVAIRTPAIATTGQVSRSLKNSMLHIKETLPDYPVHSLVNLTEEADVDLAEDITTILVPSGSAKKVEGITALPKTMEGFELNDSKKWQLFNEMASSGFYAHTVYPNRFYKEGDAEKQLAAFFSFQESIEEQIPWMRSLTLSEAGEAAYSYINSDLYEERTGDTLTFKATAKKENADSYYYFSTHKNILKTLNCKVEKIGYDLYLVAADDLTFSIVLGGV